MAVVLINCGGCGDGCGGGCDGVDAVFVLFSVSSFLPVKPDGILVRF